MSNSPSCVQDSADCATAVVGWFGCCRFAAGESACLAQLSGDTSTFNGEVAAACSFESLRDSYSMIYYDSVNYLRSSAYFEVATNLPSIRVGVSQVTTITESVGLNGAAIDVDARFYQRILRAGHS